MRIKIVLVLMVAACLSGCVAEAPGPTDAEASPHDGSAEKALAAVLLDDVLWLPIAVAMEPAVTDLAFEVNGTQRLGVYLMLGSSPTSPVPAPSSAMVRLLHDEGDQAGEVMLPPGGARDGVIEVQAPRPGSWTLRVESTGASDGQGVGAFLSYRVETGGEA